MPVRNKPYEQFGAFILFKKLESDALGELWRAARIADGAIAGTVALRKLTGGDRDALVAAAATTSAIVPNLSGTSFVRNQVVDTHGGVPFVAHDYAGGRSLRYLINRARGSNGSPAYPMPLDQAVAIAEKVALSVATTAELRYGADRLMHGALLPQFVWITDEGEIRVAGQGLGSGLIASLKDAKVGAELSRYVAPEYQATGRPSKSSEVYSLGAILFLAVTGIEPPDPLNASAFTMTMRSAKTMAGTPLPDDIRILFDKSLNLDPAARYASVADMKAAISAVASHYSATTFNLAFYISNLLKKDLEVEQQEREKEQKVNVAPYLELPEPAASDASPVSMNVPFAAAPEPQPKSRLPLAVAAVVAIAAIGGGAWFALAPKMTATRTAPAKQLASAVPAPVPQQVPPAPVMSQPIVTASPAVEPGTDTIATTATAADDEATRKKAFEDAVRKKLEEEMMKLQAEYDRKLQRERSRNAPALGVAQPAASSVASVPSTTAAEPGQRQPEARPVETAAAPTATVAPVTQPVAPPVSTATQVVVQPPPAPAVRDGDVIEFAALDRQPEAVRPIRPTYPAIAQKMKIQTFVIVSALISERGDVVDVRILKSDPRFGFDDAAVRAVRAARFSPPMKDGKRVRTWRPQTIVFAP